MTKKAVIIAIEYRDTTEELKGPFNDFEFWEKFTLDRGYEVTVLREWQATKDNIKNAFENLINNASSGDSLFFSFSGRGTQTSDDEGDEDDEEDEKILTYDLRTIKDDYFRGQLELLQTGVIFNGFVNASHSGTIFDLRYSREFYRQDGEKIYRKTTHSSYDELNATVMIFSSCADSIEINPCNYKGKKYGALTAAFIDRYNESLTYRDLLKQMFYFYESKGIYIEGGTPEITPQLSIGSVDLDKTMVNYGSVVTETRESFFEKYKFINDITDEYGNMMAFLGAEGYGCYSQGGRGGSAYWVTTLEDSDEYGTLRYGIYQQPRPTYIFFDVPGDGVISLNKKITMRNGDVTIDGLSPFAPNGITITGSHIIIDEHPTDIIIRNLRIRPHLQEYDALEVVNAKNVIFANCSASWSGDEVLSVNSDIPDVPYEPPLTDNITVQDCFIYEPFGYLEDGVRVHRFGSIISSTGYGHVSYIKNLYAHCDSRNPRIGNSENENATNPDYIDFTNNLVYNWGYTPGYQGENCDCPIRFNYIKNHYISGPSTLSDEFIFVEKGSKQSRAFFNKNKVNDTVPNENYIVVNFEGWTQEQIDEYMNTQKTAQVQTDVIDAAEVEEYVLNNSGVVLPQRDQNDTRIINDVRNRTGHLVENPDDYQI